MERRALSASEAQRLYGIDRHRIVEAVRSGDLPAARFGKSRLHILVTDLEDWIRAHAVSPENHAATRAREVLDREDASRGPGA